MLKKSQLTHPAAPLDQWPSKDIVANARYIKGLNQTEFGTSVNKTQSIISKYERGDIEPPRSVISHCMTIIRKWDGTPEPGAVSLEQVILKLRQAAALPTAPKLYLAVTAVIDAISAGM